MKEGQRFAYARVGVALLPMLPITLSYRRRSLVASGLLDTGSPVNVLPYWAGIALGAQWDQGPTLQLTGNLAHFKARPLVVTGGVSRCDPVRLVFAWTQAQEVPLILGQVNFLMEFDVYFQGSEATFEIRHRYREPGTG